MCSLQVLLKFNGHSLMCEIAVYLYAFAPAVVEVTDIMLSVHTDVTQECHQGILAQTSSSTQE